MALILQLPQFRMLPSYLLSLGRAPGTRTALRCRISSDLAGLSPVFRAFTPAIVGRSRPYPAALGLHPGTGTRARAFAVSVPVRINSLQRP
jgi:hypothetical protein